jgi:hypothetical protein
MPEITIVAAPVTETGGSLKVGTITLSQAAQGNVTVEYTTTDGTAVAPGDYTAEIGRASSRERV